MGSYFQAKREYKYKFIMFGRANSGKKTILYNLTRNADLLNEEKYRLREMVFIKHGDVDLVSYDCQGSEKGIEFILKNFSRIRKGFIFVIDTSKGVIYDESFGFNFAKKAAILSKMPVLIIANKIDIDDGNSISVAQIEELLKIPLLDGNVRIIGNSALDNKGFDEGLSWLKEEVDKLNNF
jgi:signal recognition particle receptor subunit beta